MEVHKLAGAPATSEDQLNIRASTVLVGNGSLQLEHGLWLYWPSSRRTLRLLVPW